MLLSLSGWSWEATTADSDSTATRQLTPRHAATDRCALTGLSENNPVAMVSGGETLILLLYQSEDIRRTYHHQCDQVTETSKLALSQVFNARCFIIGYP